MYFPIYALRRKDSNYILSIAIGIIATTIASLGFFIFLKNIKKQKPNE